MTPEEMDKYGIRARSYGFDTSRDVRVESRGAGLWAIIDCGKVLNKDNELEYESLPSNRTDEFIERTRFTLDEALNRAAAFLKLKQ